MKKMKTKISHDIMSVCRSCVALVKCHGRIGFHCVKRGRLHSSVGMAKSLGLVF